MTGAAQIEPAEPSSDSEPSLSKLLADNCASLDLSNVPEPVVDYARMLILDLLGAALAGVDTEETRFMLQAAEGFAAPSGPCGLWGTDRTTTAASAALVNGVIAHAQELDDFGGADHSGAVVVPAVLAVAEAETCSDGRRLLEAVIVGYDVGLRVLEGAGGYRAHNTAKGWHSTGTCGSFGAAAAAAKMLGLDAERTAWALGIAGSFTGGVWAFLADGSMSKRYHTGRAAEIGVTAAYMARAGFTGPLHVLDAEWGGFFATYCGDQARPEAVTAGLGEEHRIMKSGIKPYAACRGLHSAIDVILALRAKHGLKSRDVARIEIRCNAANMLSLCDPDPRTRLAAQMSLPYGVAVALLTGRASLGEFEDSCLNDPDVRSLLARVEMTLEPDMHEDTQPIVTLETADGVRHQGQEPIGLGDPRNPLSRDQIVAKYEDLAARALSPESVASLREAVLGLPGPNSVSTITAELRRPR